MAIALIFFLGIGNFALHKAVLESGHRLMGQISGSVRGNGGRLTLAVEFGVLLLAMMFAANGWPALVWAYFIYTLINAVSAWLILSGRI